MTLNKVNNLAFHIFLVALLKKPSGSQVCIPNHYMFSNPLVLNKSKVLQYERRLLCCMVNTPLTRIFFLRKTV